MRYQTEQEAFWAGNFGDDYHLRNNGPAALSVKTALFARALQRTHGISSVFEFGGGVGLNMFALKTLLPLASFSTIEINEKAAQKLAATSFIQTICGSALDFNEEAVADLVLTFGLLITMAPGAVQDMYQKIYLASSRYILLAEYYNPTPIEATYRGHEGFLFKRDWAGEMMDKFPDLVLVDYGFAYHRDPVFPAGDITWFLMMKA